MRNQLDARLKDVKVFGYFILHVLNQILSSVLALEVCLKCYSLCFLLPPL